MNNLQLGTLTVVKVLNNNNGGAKESVTDFRFTRNGTDEVAFDAPATQRNTPTLRER